MPDGDSADESVREAIDQSEHGAPAAGAVLRDQFETHEIFQRIIAAADEEATTGQRELFFSSLAAGFSITVTFLLYASLTAATDGHPILSALLYPLGFVFIILGGYQLYTENTLPPVVLVLERLMSLPRLFKIWGIVIVGNFAGGGFGALVLARTGVLSPEAMDAATYLAEKGVRTDFWPLFFKAAFAGVIVAGVVWLVYAVRDSFTRLVIVYLAFLAVPLGNLYHSVVSFTELAYLAFAGYDVFLPGLLWFVFPVLLGNTAGGVVLVTVVNYFQTTEERLDIARRDGFDRELTVRELLLGGMAGRSYVHKMIHKERE
ncbi:formate/nitrite transporter family protein [Halolamina sp. R1-12]|uniref:Formate/nitrite transporter FocA, FNT family n=1 Tax=Halolamina pelagica TaxID=699431 RepID=A0A1I5U9Z3_9EURY|nr:formate/nitrite transporter family protein [Halolamina sp. R1-12]SFP92103.1 Formate/nitrite transporter FocA, FNT family [Halolamina pelagica]